MSMCHNEPAAVILTAVEMWEWMDDDINVIHNIVQYAIGDMEMTNVGMFRVENSIKTNQNSRLNF